MWSSSLFCPLSYHHHTTTTTTTTVFITIISTAKMITCLLLFLLSLLLQLAQVLFTDSRKGKLRGCVDCLCTQYNCDNRNLCYCRWRVIKYVQHFHYLAPPLKVTCATGVDVSTWCLSIRILSPQGPTFVGTGSGAPEIPELPSAWGYTWATWPQGDINSGDWPSRLGVGHKASNLTLENTYCYEISNKSDLSEKAKTHKGL
jgi:hypothetical protein